MFTNGFDTKQCESLGYEMYYITGYNDISPITHTYTCAYF